MYMWPVLTIPIDVCVALVAAFTTCVMYMYVCVYIYTYIYMYMYKHTHTHTHTHVGGKVDGRVGVGR